MYGRSNFPHERHVIVFVVPFSAYVTGQFVPIPTTTTGATPATANSMNNSVPPLIGL